jgi:hypothetical protein
MVGLNVQIPKIHCPACGVWGIWSRARVPVPDSARVLLADAALPVAEWRTKVARWAEALGVAESQLEPGMIVGLPLGEWYGAATTDSVVCPLPGVFWVRSRLRDNLIDLNATGVSLPKVGFRGLAPDDEWFELVVHGRARRVDSTDAGQQLCAVCGRLGFPDPGFLRVDEARWDGSDFVCVDRNPNIVLVADRVADALAALHVPGLVMIPVR